MKQSITAVIPARMESSRFPGKPLIKIAGLPMIEHVRRRTCLAKNIDHVLVATCNQEIIDAVESCGGKAVMTANTHERCTDRVEEASKSISSDIIVIVQGDEPLLDPDILDNLISPLIRNPDSQCTNLISVIKDEKDLSDPDIVKAVLNSKNQIIYFSRAPIPFLRTRNQNTPMYRQTGLYAMRKPVLENFSKLPPTPLEISESIDLLRMLEHGIPITAVISSAETFGVDRPDDVEAIENILAGDPYQKALFGKIRRTDEK